METYEIYPPGTVIEYRLYDEVIDGKPAEVRRRGNIVSFNDELRKYHVGDKIGKSWSRYGMYWVHPSDVRKVINE
jgi:hypothetical protein